MTETLEGQVEGKRRASRKASGMTVWFDVEKSARDQEQWTCRESRRPDSCNGAIYKDVVEKAKEKMRTKEKKQDKDKEEHKKKEHKNEDEETKDREEENENGKERKVKGCERG